MASVLSAPVIALGGVDPSVFVNWENVPVHGLDRTPDGTRLLVTNTADARLEVFDLTTDPPSPVVSIPVGLEPVSVRARTDGEAWVVNHVSDSISIVDLSAANVIRTLPVGDEPADVVFAGGKAFVSVSQENRLAIFDLLDLDAAPSSVPIAGEDPRALATDGTRVFVAVFESGNETSIVPAEMVSDPGGPYGGANPPPNAGGGFDPPVAGGLPAPPEVSHIVRRTSPGVWADDNGGDWSSFVTWDLLGHDVAIVPVGNPAAVTYVDELMNLNMAIGLTGGGNVAVVGTEALSDVRFEPNLRGRFLRVQMAVFHPGSPVPSVVDLNPHLDYQSASVAPSLRDQSVADPRAVVWRSGVERGFVAGLGSNNVVEVDAAGQRLGRVEVGVGPSSLALDEPRGLLYVLNRLEGSLSVVELDPLAERHRIPFFDPTPQVIHDGRPFLYSAHEHSGLGHIGCASCHVDGKMDQVAWDLGDPGGEVKPFDQTCLVEIGPCADFHPLKGPMVTQTLVGIVGVEPLHWRGDRDDLAEFAPAFVSLQGADAEPDGSDMQAFEDFVATLRFPPNPYRGLDGEVVDQVLFNGGNPVVGELIYLNDFTDGPRRCNDCHALPTGTSTLIVPGDPAFLTVDVKVAHLRNLYEKTGFDTSSQANHRGFGIIHDGSVPNLFEGLSRQGFTFPDGAEGDQDKRDVEAFALALGTDVPGGVGMQRTADTGNRDDAGLLDELDAFAAEADGGAVGLIVRGRLAGVPRGGYLLGSESFQMDREAETATLDALLAGMGTGDALTFTVVPFETRVRLGVDRDGGGRFDGDELASGGDPTDPSDDDAIFLDGFESGSTSAWTAVVP